MNEPSPSPRPGLLQQLVQSEDWLAVLCGVILIACCLVAVVAEKPSTVKQYVTKPGEWEKLPTTSLSTVDKQTGKTKAYWPGMLVVLAGTATLFAGVQALRGNNISKFLAAYPIVFLLATIAFIMAGQSVVKYYALSYALWALLVGLVISNTVGTPNWLKPAVSSEFYIKTGLVVFGAEVLLGRLAALGPPGICVAWLVTPIVLITTFWFGQRILKMESATLNMVISADMSVCGVSAAIATAGACRAKREELSLAISMSLVFTVVMMVVMPHIIRAIGLPPEVGGAWLGGTIDSTGAVTAAGATLGPEAEDVAATVKMIQNILIGVTAFCVALYWTSRVDNGGDRKVGVSEIWIRFPKFVLGFLAVSILFSIIEAAGPDGKQLVDDTIKSASKTLRGWLFCLAFVSIGLETNFWQLLPQLKGGKPLVLYLCGQSLNLVLTLAMAYLMFGVVFAEPVPGVTP